MGMVSVARCGGLTATRVPALRLRTTSPLSARSLQRTVDGRAGTAEFLCQIGLVGDLFPRLPDPVVYPAQEHFSDTGPGIGVRQRQVTSL